MVTLKEYFTKDFPTAMSLDFNLQLIHDLSKEILVRVGMEAYSDSKFLIFYIPGNEHTLQVCLELLNNIDDFLARSNTIKVTSGFISDIHLGNVGSDFAAFSNKVYFYLDNNLNPTDLVHLDGIAKSKNLAITIRDNTYLTKKSEVEKPLAFISHDSRDKKQVALPIAIGLQRLLCPVWYDEFSLQVGDNLRESIEKGIKETKKCVLIISKNFISNSGWTKTEFDSVFTKEIIEKSNVILPVWVDVSPAEVYDYSPSLANKMALNWSQGEEKVINELYRAIAFDKAQ
ncbi:toll/interleukin-1 receptor domain-containing protein [Candidatus Berkiella cookevillensis]|uniref:TIR domain protein n=1 Tax=Candidatus Berkiella cookevillensis TaxID=437022 RepID=A0A0Q9YLU6_9GAMM|nr:toll/interleukin-1 receptor domain-containing protein [Candidatus Berkiella cookevillensis]MCS5707940.1 toll/interleukin-1 receptor domain-containing protein [Candidatus Berkiella cookevillensis]